MTHSRAEEGCIHGRFQPFHNEHLQYALAAKERCGFLWVGLARPDTMARRPLARHRERASANPLTFYERARIILAALHDHGVERGEVAVVPFPIDAPEHLSQFLPTSVRCFTTICEDWNRKKIKVLEAYGYEVEVLWERTKTITASDVRSALATGSDDWIAKVPEATANLVQKFNLADRLKMLLENEAQLGG